MYASAFSSHLRKNGNLKMKTTGKWKIRKRITIRNRLFMPFFLVVFLLMICLLGSWCLPQSVYLLHKCVIKYDSTISLSNRKYYPNSSRRDEYRKYANYPKKRCVCVEVSLFAQINLQFQLNIQMIIRIYCYALKVLYCIRNNKWFVFCFLFRSTILLNKKNRIEITWTPCIRM